MEKLNSPLNISCLHHPSRNIEAIDPNPSAIKQAYCFVCILENPQAHGLYQGLQTLPQFLDNVAASFKDERKKIKQVPANIPQSYSQILSNKDEELCKLTNHISKQKKSIEDFIGDIKSFLCDLLDKKLADLCKILDDQIVNLGHLYDSFEKKLKLCFPSQTEIELLFPSREELEENFRKVGNGSELDAFVKKIKQGTEDNKQAISFSLLEDTTKKAYLGNYVEYLEKVKTLPSGFEINSSQAFKDEVKNLFEKHIEASFALKNQIRFTCSEDPALSKLEIIRGWLPEHYKKTFTPRLIYQGSKDGISPKDFHDRCDKKGPTITIITCLFKGSSEDTVIGGFLDKDWHQARGEIISSEAFLFSLSSKIKCPFSGVGKAAYGYPAYGPIFGSGHDLAIRSDLSISSVNPSSYINSVALVNCPTYKGSGEITFIPQDIEVYTILP